LFFWNDTKFLISVCSKTSIAVLEAEICTVILTYGTTPGKFGLRRGIVAILLAGTTCCLVGTGI